MTDERDMISRREAVWRVTGLLGGLTLVGGTALLEACQKEQPREAATQAGVGAFTQADIAFLDEVADTILPDTQKSPGAKAAKTGAFMALMVTDTYEPNNQQAFRDGMKKLDAASQQANKVGFMQATPEQRLALLTTLDQEQKKWSDARAAAIAAKPKLPVGKAPDTAKAAAAPPEAKQGEAHMQGEPHQEGAIGATTANPAIAITADSPPHYFRMMKELALLGYFTSEIGYTKAMRYQETPGRFDPCLPYTKGEPAWAPHA
jgi:hypothetical protein